VVLQVATWTESYTGSNWQNAWTVSIGDGGLLGLLLGMFIALFQGRTVREFILGVY
jgi:choline/glycine/proline betaine transport protein